MGEARLPWVGTCCLHVSDPRSRAQGRWPWPVVCRQDAELCGGRCGPRPEGASVREARGCSGLPGKPDGRGPGSLCPPALRLLGRPRPLHSMAGTSHITRSHFSIVRALIFSFGFLLIFTNIVEDEQAWDSCVPRRRRPLRRAGESRG